MYAEAITAAAKARETYRRKFGINRNARLRFGKVRTRATKHECGCCCRTEEIINERYLSPYAFALIHNALGERDEALDYLEKGFSGANRKWCFEGRAKWNNLRNEPRCI